MVRSTAMYLLMQNVVGDVVKGGRIQALIDRLAARAAMKEEVFECFGKRLSTIMTKSCRF